MRAQRHGDRSSLGNILVELGYTTNATIARALARRGKLGDVLIEMGAIKTEQLDEALLYQRVYRGEISPLQASRAHQSRRRRLMAEVLGGLRDTARLSTDLIDRLK